MKTYKTSTPPSHGNVVVLVLMNGVIVDRILDAKYNDDTGNWVDFDFNVIEVDYSSYWFEVPSAPEKETTQELGSLLKKALGWDEAEFDENGLDPVEEDIYKFVERVGGNVTARYGLKDNPAMFSICADKARQYRKEFEAAGVPFLYGVFIYVISTTYPYSSQIEDRSKIAEWVIEFWNNNKSFQRIIKEEDTGESFFTIYWRNGDRTVIKAKPGEPIHSAFMRAGYSGGATAAIDWYDNGDTETHTWNKEEKKWDSKAPVPFIECRISNKT